MTASKVAKLFRNGASQAVRLPSEFRFTGTEVYISRDDISGDVVLSTRPGARVWREFFEMSPDDWASDFMPDRPMNVAPREHDLFAE